MPNNKESSEKLINFSFYNLFFALNPGFPLEFILMQIREGIQVLGNSLTKTCHSELDSESFIY